jgi:hypothetical protein
MPVTTRRQARQEQQSHLNLNNLPAEIIQEIAYQLHSDPDDSVTDFGLDFSDIDFDRMSVTSWPSEDGAPDVKVMPCCRRGDTVVVGDEARIDILDKRSTFSATSSRIRDVVFNRRQKGPRTIRYCNQWIRETMQVTEATRARYT